MKLRGKCKWEGLFMITFEEVKETNRVVNVEKGVKSMKVEREGIFKYIINEEKGTVVCVFDLGMKRALSKIYSEYECIMSKSFLSKYDTGLDTSEEILRAPYSWDTYLKVRAIYEIKKLLTDVTISNRIIKEIRYTYGKNISKMPEFKGIAKCNTEVDLFDENIGKKKAKYRMLKKFEQFRSRCVCLCIYQFTDTFLRESLRLTNKHRNTLRNIREEVRSAIWHYGEE